jgi:hypothetical protein
MRSFFFLVIALIIVFAMNQLSAQPRTDAKASVEIAGLILDSETLKPVGSAVIIDEKGIELAYTNSSGYFRARLPQENHEEIHFGFSIEKEGYEPFMQKEHWGANRNPSAAFFIGLKNKKSAAHPFSEVDADISDLSFGTVMEAYNGVKEDIDFEKKVELAKRGNENVFFEIEGAFYIVNDSGWIELKTKEDKIIINKDKVVSAEKINSVLKRKEIEGMSPIVSELASFEINTIK